MNFFSVLSLLSLNFNTDRKEDFQFFHSTLPMFIHGHWALSKFRPIYLSFVRLFVGLAHCWCHCRCRYSNPWASVWIKLFQQQKNNSFYFFDIFHGNKFAVFNDHFFVRRTNFCSTISCDGKCYTLHVIYNVFIHFFVCTHMWLWEKKTRVTGTAAPQTPHGSGVCHTQKCSTIAFTFFHSYSEI